MHPKSTPAAAELRAYFDEHTYGHADLVLERLPNDTYVWLKPCDEPAEDDDALYTITDAGRRALRMAELFGTAES